MSVNAKSGASPRSSAVSGRRRRAIPIGGLLLALALAVVVPAAPAAAHGGPARLIPDPPVVNPGGVVTIRGEDLGEDNEVTLRLRGVVGSVEIGSGVTDAEGHLSVPLAIPADLFEGRYTIEATLVGTEVRSGDLRVEGPPIEPEGEGDPQGGRDEDDPLLVVLPSGWQQALSGAVVTARPLTDTLPAGTGEPDARLVAVLAGIALLVAAGLVATLLRRRA